ncbi:major facilitator superfamily transporter [Dactylonectria estremocensis]|uniref:Major facilitator superfamily transporter n=1 Tax=Dactylonectria estremocensis TaxID=1079267 RepID=A0A9P9DQX6_9HYPO|nr:major facilitator superfamily transporter [Dactylonectria estremocensis]
MNNPSSENLEAPNPLSHHAYSFSQAPFRYPSKYNAKRPPPRYAPIISDDTAEHPADQPPAQPAQPPPAADVEKKKGKPYTAFSPWRRRFILTVVTIAGCFGPLAGNIYLPALPILEKEFNASATMINVTVSVFMLTFAIAPMFWSSFADVKGRRPLYIISLAIYIVANVLSAAVPANYAALIILRIVQAFGSAAVVSMGAGTVADVTEPSKRAFAMSIFLMGPQLGPVLGPVFGGILGQADWRWIFGFLAIGGFVLWLLIIFFLPETLRARVGSGRIYQGRSFFMFPPKFSSELAPESDRGPAPPKPSFKGYWKMFTYPPIGIVSFNTAMLYSTYFGMAVQLPTELTIRYGWDSASTGAGFLGVGLAMIAGSLLGGWYSDYRREKALWESDDGKVDPENRLADQIYGVILCALGTVMFGWFVEKSYHPSTVIAATIVTGFGMNWVFVATTAFLTECVQQQAAGAFALGNLLRNPAAAISALLIPTLVNKMGAGWCFTGLAIVDFILVGGAVTLLRVRGPIWRAQRTARMAAMKKAAAAAKP